MDTKNWRTKIWIKWGEKPWNSSTWEQIKKEWPDAEKAWTMSGQWDALIWLKPNQASLDTAEKLCGWLRSHGWAKETSTGLAKELG